MHHSAVISTSSLEQNCALEILSSFMLALAGTITIMKGKMQVVSLPAEHKPLDLALSGRSEDSLWLHPVVEALVSIVVDAELADRIIAYTIIIPALHIHGLLPATPDATVHQRPLQPDTDLYRAPGVDQSRPTSSSS